MFFPPLIKHIEPGCRTAVTFVLQSVFHAAQCISSRFGENAAAYAACSSGNT
jgi:hypothetical protein